MTDIYIVIFSAIVGVTIVGGYIVFYEDFIPNSSWCFLSNSYGFV